MDNNIQTRTFLFSFVRIWHDQECKANKECVYGYVDGSYQTGCIPRYGACNAAMTLAELEEHIGEPLTVEDKADLSQYGELEKGLLLISSPNFTSDEEVESSMPQSVPAESDDKQTGSSQEDDEVG